MTLQAPPFFFIIKINKHQQKETRETDGVLAISYNYVFMQHEVQNGEIVSIGELAQKLFPDAKIGYTLIFHHFVTGKGVEDREASPYLVHEDENFNYYKVTVRSYNGDRNLTYGVWDGEKITPHKDFIFLEVPDNKKEVVKTDTLIEIKNWSESRDKKNDRLAEIKSSIGELTKTFVSKDLKAEIENREKEMGKISQEINKKQIELYKVAYSDLSLPFKEVGILNIATSMKVPFMGKEYIVAQSKYIYFGNSAN